MTRSENSLDKNKIARSFSRYAQTYDKFAGLQKQLAKELVDTVKKLDISPNNILDIGTGTGEVAFLLQALFPNAKIKGCDLAPGMIQVAKQKNISKNISFDVADAEVLPYRPETFDLVVSSTTYQWVENLRAAFGEANRVLKNKCNFVFTTFGPDSLKELKTSFRLNVDENAEYLHTYKTLSEIASLLELSEFKVINLNSRLVRTVYPNLREMLKKIKSIGALNASAKLPKGLRSKSKIKKMTEHYERIYCMEDSIYATYEIIEAVCVKI